MERYRLVVFRTGLFGVLDTKTSEFLTLKYNRIPKDEARNVIELCQMENSTANELKKQLNTTELQAQFRFVEGNQ